MPTTDTNTTGHAISDVIASVVHGTAAASKALVLDANLQAPGQRVGLSIKTANYTVTAADSGTVFVANAADIVFTLPSTAAGLEYTFVCAAVSSGTGLSVSPAAADNINEGTDNKDLINSGATDVLGDSVTVIGDGSLGWYTTSKIGTWAAES